MKRILMMILIFLLVGCKQNENDIFKNITDSVTSIGSSTYNFNTNQTKHLYDYYLEPSNLSSSNTDTSNIVEYLGNEIVLNLNVANILNDEFYEDKSKVSSLLFLTNRLMNIDGTFIDIEGNEVDYRFEIYKIEDEYLLYLNTVYFELISINSITNIEIIANKMMLLAKSISINYDRVIDEYSNVVDIDFKKEDFELYKSIVPENGPLSEILKEKNKE